MDAAAQQLYEHEAQRAWTHATPEERRAVFAACKLVLAAAEPVILEQVAILFDQCAASIRDAKPTRK